MTLIHNEEDWLKGGGAVGYDDHLSLTTMIPISFLNWCIDNICFSKTVSYRHTSWSVHVYHEDNLDFFIDWLTRTQISKAIYRRLRRNIHHPSTTRRAERFGFNLRATENGRAFFNVNTEAEAVVFVSIANKKEQSQHTFRRYLAKGRHKKNSIHPFFSLNNSNFGFDNCFLFVSGLPLTYTNG